MNTLSSLFTKALGHGQGLLISVIWILVFGSVGAQNQTVSGKIQDELGNPLTGASVQMSNSDTTLVSTSDEQGRFSVKVKPSRYIITVSFVGYSTFTDELLVITGKSVELNITLIISSSQLSDVTVSAGNNQNIAGSYTISIEKTMRVPANFFDPLRMATSLPGVVATNDQANSISIKGYSPNAMLWRLNGLDIVNPNHLANAGTLSDKPVANGGGVSVLSSQVLDKTQFYSGALPIQYGNALSGAFDMSLRQGNKQKQEYTAQASLIGLDVATEGPLAKGKSSYLVNYRYSTVGLLSQLGVNFGDEKINFQDLTFNLDFEGRKGNHTSVFGFGGLSSNIFDRKPQADWKTEKDRYNIDFYGKVFGVGLNSTLFSSTKSNLKFGLAYSGQYQARKSQSEDLTTADLYIDNDHFNSDRSMLSGSLEFNQQPMASVSWHAGMKATAFQQHLYSLAYYAVSGVIVGGRIISGDVDGVMWQPYLNVNWKLNWIDLNAGIRYVQFSYNNSSSIEPRISASSKVFNGLLSFNYGITSQMQQTQVYIAPNNKNLDLTRAHQFLMSYRKNFKNNFSLSANGFYHRLIHVPGSKANVPYSALNLMNEFAPDNLSSIGLGKNYGADVTVEKKFDRNLYFMLSGSWYQSGFGTKSNTYYTSRFNGKFTVSATGGKEWLRKKSKTFGVHLRALYIGGLRQQQIDPALSQTNGDTRYYDNNLFSVHLPDYYRLDLRVSWRRNRPKYTRTISIDIQNLTNHLNVGYYYYDTYLKRVETKYQLGLIPMLVYRIDF